MAVELSPPRATKPQLNWFGVVLLALAIGVGIGVAAQMRSMPALTRRDA